jgi:hypothetical protein
LVLLGMADVFTAVVTTVVVVDGAVATPFGSAVDGRPAGAAVREGATVGLAVGTVTTVERDGSTRMADEERAHPALSAPSVAATRKPRVRRGAGARRERPMVLTGPTA